jgi:transposase
VLVAKYGWHLPLYRQAKMLASHGLDLDRSTLASGRLSVAECRLIANAEAEAVRQHLDNAFAADVSVGAIPVVGSSTGLKPS